MTVINHSGRGRRVLPRGRYRRTAAPLSTVPPGPPRTGPIDGSLISHRPGGLCCAGRPTDSRHGVPGVAAGRRGRSRPAPNEQDLGPHRMTFAVGAAAGLLGRSTRSPLATRSAPRVMHVARLMGSTPYSGARRSVNFSAPARVERTAMVVW